jgi:signal transduction histidine kinase
VGTVGDFGFIDGQTNGKKIFVSLLEHVPKEYRDFVDVWKTSVTPDGVYFKTNKYIFLWDGVTMKPWVALKSFAFSFVVGDNFYVKEDSLGLICFKNRELAKLPAGEFFKGKDIRSIVGLGKDSILISTLGHGMFIYSAKAITSFKTQADDFLKKNLIFASSRVNDDYIAFGTFRGGLLLMNNKGAVRKIVSEEHGLRENSIRALFLDREGGLWVALNNGISRVEVNSPVTFFDKRMNINGSVYQINRHKNVLYIGTSVGLSYLPPHARTINTIDKFADQVWSLYSINDEQLLGTNTSSYRLRDLTPELINNSGGSFTFLQSKQDDHRVFVGLRDGLQSLYQTKTGWKVEQQLKPIKGQVKNLIEDCAGRLWVQSNQAGVARIEFGKNKKLDVKFLSTESGVPVTDRYKLVLLNGDLHIFIGLKVLRFDSVANKFVASDISISGAGSASASVINLTTLANGDMISWSNSTVGFLRKDETVYRWDSQPFYRVRDKAINSVYADGDSLVWIASANGLYRIDLRSNSKTFDNFETQIRAVSDIDTDSLFFSGEESKQVLSLSSSFSKIRFEFSSTFFDQSNETQYQTFLDGVDKDWSAWSAETSRDYTNLWEGTYTFHVRSKNIYRTLGKETQYTFVILPPWYRTKAAYLLYVIGVIASFYVGVRTYYNNLKRANKRLEALIQARTSKINSQKEEIESQRDNLAQAHRTIEKQNNELLLMNHELEKIVEERTSELTKSNIELLEVNKELDRFVYRAAHDLRGPVATLLGLCNLSVLETRDQTAIEYLSKIRLTAERLNFLLFMLLKINRIKTTEIKPGPINLKELLDRVISSILKNYDNASAIQVTTTVDPALDVYSDKELVQIIFENLIDNAFKFSKLSDAPVVTIDVKKQANRIHVCVIDRGIGINEDFQNKIFDMFFIGTAESKGLGLGLHAAQLAAKKLKGTVRLDHSNGVETKFVVDLPERC